MRFSIGCMKNMGRAWVGEQSVLMVVDTTLVPIKMKGSRDNSVFYSVKHGLHGMKVELASVVACDYGPFILSCNVAPGSSDDLTIARADLVKHLLPGEQILADRTYEAPEAPEFLTPTTHHGVHPDNVPDECRRFDAILESHLVPIKRVHGWLHTFCIFSRFEHYYRGEHPGPRLDLLIDVIDVAVLLVNRNVLDMHGEQSSMFIPHRENEKVDCGRLG